MRSVERRFNKIAKKHYDWSTYTCFAETVSRMNFNHQTIHRWFNQLVDEDDYCKKEKKEITAFLKSIAQGSRTTKKQG